MYLGVPWVMGAPAEMRSKATSTWLAPRARIRPWLRKSGVWAFSEIIGLEYGKVAILTGGFLGDSFARSRVCVGVSVS